VKTRENFRIYVQISGPNSNFRTFVVFNRNQINEVHASCVYQTACQTHTEHRDHKSNTQQHNQTKKYIYNIVKFKNKLTFNFCQVNQQKNFDHY